jgi:CubicO group peptidase (beta-lactamase class C family)
MLRHACAGILLLLVAACSSTDRADRTLHGLRPAVDVAGRPEVRWTIEERMAHHGVPGVSLAVVDGGRIVWSRGFGVQEVGGAERVTPQTPFQAASISKVIAATATLRLVDDGKLDLDTDVNQYLRTWKVPESEFTATEKVTLRRLLSHTAGTNVHGFVGYAPDVPRPTLLQVLDAQPPAANKAIRVTAIPGSATSYSGGGIVIEQLVLTDASGRAFPELAQELVLGPLQMHDSTFAQPLPELMQKRAARGHDEEGKVIPGGWAIGPEMAAGWLWTTAADLMRWAVAIDESRRGTPGSILSRKTASDMLTVQKDLYGLGPVLEGSGRALAFGHGGNNPGYTTQVMYFPETRQGFAILVNKVGADMLIEEITRAIAGEYDWPALQSQHVQPATLSETDVTRIAGTYALRFPGAPEPSAAEIRRDGNRLLLTAPPILQDDEIIPTSPSAFLSPAWGYTLELQHSSSGEVTGFVIHYGQNVFTATR